MTKEAKTMVGGIIHEGQVWINATQLALAFCKEGRKDDCERIEKMAAAIKHVAK